MGPLGWLSLILAAVAYAYGASAWVQVRALRREVQRLDARVPQ